MLTWDGFISYGTLRLPNNEKIEGQWSTNRLIERAIHTEAVGDRFEEFYRDGIAEGARKPLKRTGKEMEEILKSSSAPTWQLDAEVMACFACDKPFSLFNRVSSGSLCSQMIDFLISPFLLIFFTFL